MKAWWNSISIRNKLQIPIQLFLLVIMVFVQQFALNRFESHVLAGARHNALLSADGVLNGLNMLMLNGIISDEAQRTLYVSKMGESDKIVNLRIMRNQLINEQYGKGLPSEQSRDELDQAAMNTGEVQMKFSRQNERDELRVVVPFKAQSNFRGTNCLSCHNVPEGKTVGAASITLNLTDEFNLIAKVNLWVWILQVLLQIILYVVIGKLIYRITAPILHSANVANKIAAGDLSSIIHAEGSDEIAQQLRAMKSMQDSLRNIITETKSIVQAGLHGDFSVKMGMLDKEGYTKELSELLNRLTNTVEDAFNDTIRVTTALAAGDLSEKITNHYDGAYDQVKQSVNTTADSLSKIVGEIKEIVESAAIQGDFSVTMNTQDKSGYARELAELLNQLCAITQAGLSDVLNAANVLAKGDLTHTIDKHYPGAFGEVNAGMNSTMLNLKALVGKIKDATDVIHSASKKISAGNSDFSQRSEEQATGLKQTAAAMEKLTTAVKRNSEDAHQANQLAVGASEIAVKGGEVVHQVVITMSTISNSSKKIADIISVIDGIAFQTNILALNAAVEAARAGEQGRGFAVVAHEVRNLAQRSANAAKEIKTLIDNSVNSVSMGAELVEKAGNTMEEVVKSVRRVTDIMGDITIASAQQSREIEQVNRAITQIDDVTRQNATLVEQAAAAAKLLEDQAQELAYAVSVFRV